MVKACVQCHKFDDCRGVKFNTCTIVAKCTNCKDYPCKLTNCTPNGFCGYFKAK